MPRRKQTKRTTVKDIRAILRLTQEGLSVRAISERLGLSKTSVATYQLRARQAGLCWPLPPDYDDERALERVLFGRVGRPPQDLAEPDWPVVAQELKRPGVTLTLLWQEYRTAHPEGYGYTWFCEQYGVFKRRANPTFRNRHEAGAVMQTDYAGQTVEVIDPQTGEIRQAQIFVAVLAASSLTFAMASFSQKLPDWIAGQICALNYFGGVPRAIVCDNLKAGVVKALWFEPTLNQTFAAMAEHYDTTILPTRSRRPRDKGIGPAILLFRSIGQLGHAHKKLLTALHAAESANVAKSQFLANMSHELRTPLNAVIGFADLMGTEPFGPLLPRYKSYAADIRKAGLHLLDVINDVLDISKAETVEFSVHMSDVDLGEVFAEVETLAAGLALDASIALLFETTANSGPIMVSADRIRLKQALLNLVSNGIKFNNAGGSVTVRAFAEAGTVRIEIQTPELA